MNGLPSKTTATIDLAVQGGLNDEGKVSLAMSSHAAVYSVLCRINRLTSEGRLASTTLPDLFSLKGSGALVTGGARGLGLAIATSLLEASCPYVCCLDILPTPNQSEWEQATATAKKYSGTIEYRQLDITDETAASALFSKIYEQCPEGVELKCLFAAAGIQQMIPALEYPIKEFRRIMEVNITGEYW
jgi:hypothetical protein